ncbi:hypothetical protein Hanom_Chr07g00635321 [Helianthus anomalus]
MAKKLKPQGPRCKKFEFWTKVAKVTKPQGPKWQFTLKFKKENFSHKARKLDNTSSLQQESLEHDHR